MLRRSLRKLLTRLAADSLRPLSALKFLSLPPPATFSALAQLRQGEAFGKVVLKKQPMPRFGKNSMTLRSRFNQHLQQPWPIFWAHYAPARLFSNSLALLDNNFNLMIESAFGRFYKNDSAWISFVGQPPRKLLGSWTSIISEWCPLSVQSKCNYYHWLFDALPRLGCLKHFPATTRILVPRALPAFAMDSLEMLGLKKRCLAPDSNHLLIDDYYYSGIVGMTGCHNPYAIRFLRKSFLPHASSANQPTRFFVARRHSARGIINNIEVIDFFQRKGWSVVYLESLSFADQIKLFRDAESICALHGAALANLAWCNPKTFIFEIFSHNYLQGVYEGIAKINRLNYQPIVFKARRDRCLKIDLAILHKHLKDLI
jgi:hypothetical protein